VTRNSRREGYSEKRRQVRAVISEALNPSWSAPRKHD